MCRRKETILLILIFLLTHLNTALSQTFNGGLTAGLNTSQIDGDRFGGYYKAGITAGAFVNYKIKTYAGLQMELYFIQKGAGKKPDQTNATFYKVKLDYVELPILFFYEASDRLIFDIGISGAVLVRSTEDLDGAGDMVPNPAFNSSDYSAIIGINYRLNNLMAVRIRYSHSVIPIRKHPGNQTYFLNRGQYNNCLTFALTYRIHG